MGLKKKKKKKKNKIGIKKKKKNKIKSKKSREFRKNEIFIYSKDKMKYNDKKHSSIIKPELYSENNKINPDIEIKIFNFDEKIKNEKIETKYSEEEINDLSYDLALQYDKRSYFDYYISLIKTKHN